MAQFPPASPVPCTSHSPFSPSDLRIPLPSNMHIGSALPLVTIPRTPHAVTLLLVPFIVYLYHDSFLTSHYGPFFRVITFLYFFVPPAFSLATIHRRKPTIKRIVLTTQTIGLFTASTALMIICVLLGLETAAILVSQDSMFNTALLDTDSQRCIVRATQTTSTATSWSGLLYIIGLALLIVTHSATVLTYLLPQSTKLMSVPIAKVSIDREDFKIDENKTGTNLQNEVSTQHKRLSKEVKVEKEEKALRKSFEIVDTPPSFPPSSGRRSGKEGKKTVETKEEETKVEEKKAEKKREKKKTHGKKKGKKEKKAEKGTKVPSSDSDAIADA